MYCSSAAQSGSSGPPTGLSVSAVPWTKTPISSPRRYAMLTAGRAARCLAFAAPRAVLKYQRPCSRWPSTALTLGSQFAVTVDIASVHMPRQAADSCAAVRLRSPGVMIDCRCSVARDNEASSRDCTSASSSSVSNMAPHLIRRIRIRYCCILLGLPHALRLTANSSANGARLSIGRSRRSAQGGCRTGQRGLVGTLSTVSDVQNQVGADPGALSPRDHHLAPPLTAPPHHHTPAPPPL